MQVNQTELFMNMRQFSDLKLEARQNSAQATKAVAQQFEGLFIQMMQKDMRAAATMDKSQHSSYMDFYTDMYDKQISQILSKQGGIGIARMMQQQMQQFTADGQTSAASNGTKLPVYRLPVMKNTELPMSDMTYVASNPAVKTHQLKQNIVLDEMTDAGHKVKFDHDITEHVNAQIDQTVSLVGQTIEPFFGWQKADSFVQDLWPHAQKAASKLGVSADVLVAQSALETGWGKHAMKKADGSIAFNLFGIKAGNDWVGQSVSQNTLEFRDGIMQQEKAHFRAYDSVSDAVDDYVEFVQSRSRYADALKHGGSDLHYVKGLQKAGYATDPDYARKINNIINSQTFKQAVNALATGKLSNTKVLS